MIRFDGLFTFRRSDTFLRAIKKSSPINSSLLRKPNHLITSSKFSNGTPIVVADAAYFIIRLRDIITVFLIFEKQLKLNNKLW